LWRRRSVDQGGGGWSRLGPL